MNPSSDRQFLMSLGIAPFDPEYFRTRVETEFRDRVFYGVAVIQAIAIVAGIIWTSV